MDKCIFDYYKKNKQALHDEFKIIENIIDGRICHSSIILLKILCNIEKIENYLEIGIHNGGSIALLLSNKNSKNLYGIDLFEDIYSENKHYNKEKFTTYQYFRRDNLSKYKTEKNLDVIKKMYNYKEKIHLIQGNSYFDETEDKIKAILHEELDLLFLDGDHTLDGVRNDFERYSKYVKKGGYIIFDDYHHEIIKKYCDGLLIMNNNYEKICTFKSYNSQAIDLLVKKL